MGNMIARNYRGTRDWLAGEVLIRQKVIDTLRDVFQRFGFEPLETPELELYEVLSGKYGPEADELSYNFRKGDDWIGLRYDHTVPLARVAIQHQHEIVLPYRRYAIGATFRADEPQPEKGRYRRFIQCDFDTVGIPGPSADAEVVVLTYTALRELGFDEFEVQVCDRRLLNGMAKATGANSKELIVAFLRSWDKIEKTDRKQIAEELGKAGASPELIAKFFEVTDQLLSLPKEGIIEELRELFPNQPSVTEGTAVLEEMLGYIKDFNVPSEFYRVNPCLARGLDYYTGPIFETVVKKASVGSITGGGRFDELIKTLGGPDIPATGSSFGLERIVSVMETLGIAKPQKTATQVFVATFNPNSSEMFRKAVQITARLRGEGIKTELNMEKCPIGGQLGIADRRGIPIAVFAGPKEMEAKSVVVKDLRIPFGSATQKQQWVNQWKIPEESLIEKVKELLKPT